LRKKGISISKVRRLRHIASNFSKRAHGLQKMRALVYLNGHYLPIEQARISIFDRGFLFGEAIYEVLAVIDSRLIDVKLHMARLRRSLKEVGLDCPIDNTAFLEIFRRLVNENSLKEGIVYLQISAGAELGREFVPRGQISPTIVAFTQDKVIVNHARCEDGVAVLTQAEARWNRRDIKSVNLLATIMAKRHASYNGAFEAWFVEDGLVTEGASSTAFIVRNCQLITRSASTSLLEGCTALAVGSLCAEHGLGLVQRAFTVKEAVSADEAFLTSASNFIVPVTSIDGFRIGSGLPGPVTRRMQQLFLEHALRTAV
jgi:D-alanine transaminase